MMKYKSQLNNLKTLFLCPSENYTSIEKRVLEDCLSLKNAGGFPTLFCIQDSHIDNNAQKNSLTRYFYRGKKVSRFFGIKYYFDLKKILKENEFDLIHCYGFDYVWVVCLLVMTKKKYPLVLTVNKVIEKNYDNFIEKWFLKRIDLVLTFSESIKSMLNYYLGLAHSKIRVVGAGVNLDVQDPKTPNISAYAIGTSVTTAKQLKQISCFLYAIKGINDLVAKKNKYSIFVLQDSDLLSELEQYKILASELELSDNVSFIEVENTKQIFKEVDIYVSISVDEPFSSLEVNAMLSKIPTVTPRTAARVDLLRSYSNSALTYKDNDSRELRDSIIELIRNNDEFREHLEENYNALRLKHGDEHYFDHVYEGYFNVLAGRSKMVSIREKTN